MIGQACELRIATRIIAAAFISALLFAGILVGRSKFVWLKALCLMIALGWVSIAIGTEIPRWWNHRDGVGLGLLRVVLMTSTLWPGLLSVLILAITARSNIRLQNAMVAISAMTVIISVSVFSWAWATEVVDISSIYTFLSNFV